MLFLVTLHEFGVRYRAPNGKVFNTLEGKRTAFWPKQSLLFFWRAIYQWCSSKLLYCSPLLAHQSSVSLCG